MKKMLSESAFTKDDKTIALSAMITNDPSYFANKAIECIMIAERDPYHVTYHDLMRSAISMIILARIAKDKKLEEENQHKSGE